MPPSLPDKAFGDVTGCIGNTPLVKLRRLAEDGVATVLGKLENLNPLWSVKDRIARSMIDAAERDGLIRPETVIIEPGQIQILNNRSFGHGRTAYTDPPDPAKRRHLLRLWHRDLGRRAYSG